MRNISLLYLIYLILNLYFQSFLFAQHSLVDDQADPNVVGLHTHLKLWAADKVLFGQQDALAYGVLWKRHRANHSDVKSIARSHPAIVGWELSKIGISPYNIDSVDFESMKKWIIKVHKQGGINTISWHMDNLVTGGNTWDTAGSVVRHILPGGSHHAQFLTKLDFFIKFLGDLKYRNKPVPIIFRPYHEHTGSWFWWGKNLCTVDEYKQLWKFTVEYLRDKNNIHQLLYAYSPDVIRDSIEYLERYPGDAWVDIMGLDDYHDVGVHANKNMLGNRLEILVDLANAHDKIAAFTETGQERIPQNDFWTETLLKQIMRNKKTQQIAYVMVWRNASLSHHYGPYKGHSSEENFKTFIADKRTWLLKDLPQWQVK